MHSAFAFNHYLISFILNWIVNGGIFLHKSTSTQNICNKMMCVFGYTNMFMAICCINWDQKENNRSFKLTCSIIKKNDYMCLHLSTYYAAVSYNDWTVAAVTVHHGLCINTIHYQSLYEYKVRFGTAVGYCMEPQTHLQEVFFLCVLSQSPSDQLGTETEHIFNAGKQSWWIIVNMITKISLAC